MQYNIAQFCAHLNVIPSPSEQNSTDCLSDQIYVKHAAPNRRIEVIELVQIQEWG